MRRKTWGLVLLIVLLSAISIFGCTKPPNEGEAESWNLQMLGGPGGLDMIASAAVCDILQENNKDISISVVKTMDIDSHFFTAQELKPNEVLIAMNNNSYIANTLSSVTDQPFTNIRWIAGWNSGVFAFITTDPSIKTLGDCSGKKLAILPGPIEGSNELILETLKELGIHDSVTIKKLAFNEQYEALKDGLVDVAIYAAFGGNISDVYPQPGIVELAQTMPDSLFLVGWPHETLEKVYRKVGYSRPLTFIPEGTLKTQEGPVEAQVIVTPALACREEADEDLIYRITKTLCEHVEEFVDYHPSFSGTTVENMIKMMPLYSESEVHAGALKYYKEIGVWEDAWENRYWVGPEVLP